MIISRDLTNTFNSVKNDIDAIAAIVKKDIPVAAREVELGVLKRKVSDSLDKMDKYLGKDIEQLG